MGTAERVAPQRDAAEVDVLAAASECDGGPQVLLLTADVGEPPRLATALSEAAIVEHEGRHVLGGEPWSPTPSIGSSRSERAQE
ncbi:hypothetical protein Q9G87_01370 [Nonomuraea sp. G32]|nr:hypothetical protein [Nonomuraea sp. G32]MDP4500602.1 hypothetical protein [Nonomuraea sp. G32]